MTLTDEEAREIIEMLAVGLADEKRHGLRNNGAEYRRLITLLESRIGVEDELTTAYQFGFERGLDAGRKERR